MRVAILASFPPQALPALAAHGPPPGHYATWLPHLARAFEPHTATLDLHWVALVPDPRLVGVHHWKGQTFHFLPTALRGRASSLYRADRQALQARLAEIRPDLVHGWGNEDVYGLAAAFSGYPNIVGVQGLLSYYVLKTRMHPRDWFQAAIELVVLRRADTLVAESPWACRMASRHAGGRPVRRVEYGVQEVFRQTAWNPAASPPTALFCGRADSRKGIRDVVAAFRSPRLAGARLRILGDASDPEAAALRAKASSNVEWAGRQPIEETARAMGDAWCLVLPTRCDTGPMAVKEARVVGLPVIAGPDSGASDYIEEGRNGFLVRPGDVATLTDRLSTLLADRERCRAMGNEGHAAHREQFSAAATASGFSSLYAEVAAAARPRA